MKHYNHLMFMYPQGQILGSRSI